MSGGLENTIEEMTEEENVNLDGRSAVSPVGSSEPMEPTSEESESIEECTENKFLCARSALVSSISCWHAMPLNDRRAVRSATRRVEETRHSDEGYIGCKTQTSSCEAAETRAKNLTVADGHAGLKTPKLQGI